MADPKSKVTSTELLGRIHEMHLDDELERIARLSDDDLDGEVRALGGDPAAIRGRGASFVRKEKVRVEALAKFQEDALDRLTRALEAADNAPKTPALPRRELLARIDRAMKRPSLAQPMAMAFKKRKREEASDDELRSFLDRIAALEAIAEAEGLDPRKKER